MTRPPDASRAGRRVSAVSFPCFFLTVLFWGLAAVLPAAADVAVPSPPSGARELMKDVKGCALVMDLHTGEVLDAYNLSRAVGYEYPSTSVLKPVVALGALRYGVLSPEEKVEGDRKKLLKQYGDSMRSYLNRDLGALDLGSAMAASDNLFFYVVGERLGEERVRTLYESFSFGKVTGLDPAKEKPGRIPKGLTGAERLHFLGWGSKSMRVTAAQLLVAMAAFGNGGYQLRPFLGPKAPKVVSRIAAEEEFTQVRKALRRVVTEGTGRDANRDGYSVYGKTGSVFLPGTTTPLGVFAGFTEGAPRDVAFVVIVEGASAPRAVRLAGKLLDSLEKALGAASRIGAQELERS